MLEAPNMHAVIPGPWRAPVTDSKLSNTTVDLLSNLFSTMDRTRLRQMGPQPQKFHVLLLQQHRQSNEYSEPNYLSPCFFYVLQSTTRTASLPAAAAETGGKARHYAHRCERVMLNLACMVLSILWWFSKVCRVKKYPCPAGRCQSHNQAMGSGTNTQCSIHTANILHFSLFVWKLTAIILVLVPQCKHDKTWQTIMVYVYPTVWKLQVSF